LERAENSSSADALLKHYEENQEGEAYVARSAWRAPSKERALRALQAIAGGTGTAAAEAMVSLARLGDRYAKLSSALDSQDPYRRLNAALAAGYLGDQAEIERLAAMLQEAASTIEKVFLSAALAMLGRPNGATALNDELVAAGSAPEYEKRLDIFFLHRYLQTAILDAFRARDSEGIEHLDAWQPELEPLEPVPKPVPAQRASNPITVRSQPSRTKGSSRPVQMRRFGASTQTTVVSGRESLGKVSSQPTTMVGSSKTAPLNVFISYSHGDEKMRKKLGQHLAPLVDDGLIRIWHDRGIEAGADWAGEINKEIASADIILLLVSAAFLNSRYCRSELQKALKQRGAGKTTPIPIILRDCDWTSVFNTAQYKIQALPRDDRPVAGGSWANHDAAYTAIVKELRTKIVKMRE